MTVDQINNMTHTQMANHYRNAPLGTPEFMRDTPECKAFNKRWEDFGGWNPVVSKQVGWN